MNNDPHPARTCRRIGVSAYRRVREAARRGEVEARRRMGAARRYASLYADTPIHRPADTSLLNEGKPPVPDPIQDQKPDSPLRGNADTPIRRYADTSLPDADTPIHRPADTTLLNGEASRA